MTQPNFDNERLLLYPSKVRTLQAVEQCLVALRGMLERYAGGPLRYDPPETDPWIRLRAELSLLENER
jgi:hypothetical protein